MHAPRTRHIILFTAFIAMLSCSSGDAIRSDGKRPAESVFDHKAAQDTVSWQTLRDDGTPLVLPETDLEWPGEQMGIVGPIVAVGGTGSKRYVQVFDPAGVLVGIMTRKEVQKHPERLEQLLQLAHKRGEVQNLNALEFMALRRIQDMMAASDERKAP